MLRKDDVSFRVQLRPRTDHIQRLSPNSRAGSDVSLFHHATDGDDRRTSIALEFTPKTRIMGRDVRDYRWERRCSLHAAEPDVPRFLPNVGQIMSSNAACRITISKSL
jgi:hypothetical protein